MQTIGFIGTGVMGASMAGHLLDAGYALHVFTRSRAKAEGLIARGALWAESVAALTTACDVVFTIVGFPRDVEEVYFGESGLLAHLKPGAIAVDMTTSRPDLAMRIAAEATRRGAAALDAPVSGGDKGARAATLSIMAGGDPAAFDAVRPLFEKMGKSVVLQGPAGSGQHCKLCNQILIATTMLGVCEALAYARKVGLNPETVLQSVSSGAAASWTLSNLAPRMLGGDWAPGFYVKHFIKDMDIAAASADALGLDTPGLDAALAQYRRLAEAGRGDCGTQALLQLYSGMA